MRKIFFILLLLIPILSPGQVKTIGTPKVLNYSKTEYKAGTQNWDVAQDKNGFIYFANNSGLLQFDGFHWQLIDVPLSLVRSVLVDSDDRIFVGLLYDFGTLVKTEAGDYEYKSLLDFVPEEHRDFNDVWKIHEIDGQIIFQAYEKFFVYNGEEVKTFNPTEKFHFSFNVYGRLLIHEPGVGLFEMYNGFVDKVPWAAPLKDLQILSILETGNNSLLIGTAQNGLYSYSNGTLAVWDTEVNEALMNSKFFSADNAAENHFAFGTILDGLYISDQNGRIVQHINRDSELQNNTVLSVFLDKGKNLWLGLDNGIGYVEVNSPVSYITEGGGIGTGYCCVVYDDKLYMGTNQGLFVRPFKDLEYSDESFELVENSEGQVWSLQVFDNQLICGHNFGTFLIEDKKAIQITDIPGGWGCITLENHPDLLLGGHYDGLILLEKRGGKWEFKKRVVGFEESSRFLVQDDNGEIWMSHGGKGIYQLRLSELADSVTAVRLYGEADGLPSNNDNMLFVLDRNKYISTIDGVYSYDKSTDGFSSDEEMNDLFGVRERIKKVVTDDAGNIWYISENKSGVLRRNEDISYTNITSPFEVLNEHYVNDFEFIYPRNNDHIFLGIDAGFAHYSSKFPKSFVKDFRSFITKVELNYLDSVLYPFELNGISYQFPFKQNAFRFHYTAPFFENLSDLRFSYLLENYSNEWSPWTVDVYRDFTNLPYGEYSFKIRALNNYGVESEESSFDFTILPPWYHTSLAYVVYVLLLLLSILFAAYLIRRRIERSKRRARQKHEEELRAKEEMFQHQAVVAEKEIIKLRNDKLRADMIYRDKELANQTMGIIQKNKFLRKLNDELKVLQKSTDDAAVRTKIALIKNRISKETENRQQKVFETYFDEVHEEFFKRLKEKFPQLSPKDLRLCAYIKMNISSKEIASLLNISYRGVEISRYRLRKKMDLSREVNLSTFLSGF